MGSAAKYELPFKVGEISRHFSSILTSMAAQQSRPTAQSIIRPWQVGEVEVGQDV